MIPVSTSQPSVLDPDVALQRHVTKYGSTSSLASSLPARIKDAGETPPLPDDEPLKKGNLDRLISIAEPPRTVGGTRTLINLVRGMIGPGCMGLPFAISQGGLWFGLFASFGLGALNTHCMFMLISCSKRLQERSNTSRPLDYGDMAKKAMEFGPKGQKLATPMMYVVNCLICLLAMSVVAVQFVFIGANLSMMITNFQVLNLGVANVSLSPLICMTIVLPPIVLLCYVQNLKLLAYLSMIGNIAMIVGFIVIFQHIVVPPNEINVNKTWFEDFNGLFVFLGSALYAFEGQAMILPMENAMKRRYKMVRPFGVLDTGMALVTIIYAATGFFGYAKYGDKTLGSITLNLPNTALYQIVTLTLTTAVLLGIPLQTYIPMEFTWRGVRKRLAGSRWRPYRDLLFYVLVTALVLICYVLAMLVPNLSLIIPLVGNSTGMILSFIFPPLLHIWAHWTEWAEHFTGLKRQCYIFKDLLILCFGIVAMICGLYVNFKQISAQL